MDWRQRLDDPEVPGIIRTAVARARRGAYSHPRDAALLDDVESWAYVSAVAFARRFNPQGPNRPAVVWDEQRLFRAQLLAYLHTAIARGWHRAEFNGKGGSAERLAVARTASLEALLAEDLTIGATLHSPDDVNPERVILRREYLEELIDRAEHEPPPEPDGLCTADLCNEPVRCIGLCINHYAKEFRARKKAARQNKGETP